MTDEYDPERNRELALSDYGYVPTTEEIREGFANGDDDERIQPNEDKFWQVAARRREEFYRWLAENDRAVAERVWDEAVDARPKYDHETYDENPYAR